MFPSISRTGHERRKYKFKDACKKQRSLIWLANYKQHKHGRRLDARQFGTLVSAVLTIVTRPVTMNNVSIVLFVNMICVALQYNNARRRNLYGTRRWIYEYGHQSSWPFHRAVYYCGNTRPIIRGWAIPDRSTRRSLAPIYNGADRVTAYKWNNIDRKD